MSDDHMAGIITATLRLHPDVFLLSMERGQESLHKLTDLFPVCVASRSKVSNLLQAVISIVEGSGFE
jgi:hypothetical protein